MTDRLILTRLLNAMEKISPIRDWWSTPTYCQLQSYVTQKLGQKFRPW